MTTTQCTLSRSTETMSFCPEGCFPPKKNKSSHDSDNLFHGSLRDCEPLKADLTLLADVVAFCVTPSREPTETNQKALTGTGGQQLRSRKCMLTGLTGPVVLGFCVTAWTQYNCIDNRKTWSQENTSTLHRTYDMYFYCISTFTVPDVTVLCIRLLIFYLFN
jgi:hypothetical protein